jgi:ABC-2 type transport system permease protein
VRGASEGAIGAVRLLVGLRLRRLLNQVQVSWQVMLRHPISGMKRTATPGKARLGWLLAGLIGISMTFTVTHLAVQGMENLQRALGSVQVAKTEQVQEPKSQARVPLPPAPGNTLPAGVLQGVALELLILLAAAFFLSLGSGDLGKPDWDLEWLVTLPLSLATLLAVRIAERTFLSGGLLLLWPFLTIVAWEAGYSLPASVALGVLGALPMLAMVATLRTIVDTGLRLSVSPGTLRNLQAVTGLVAVLFLYLGMSPGTSSNSYVMDWAPVQPGWAFWLPPGLATIALTATDKGAIGLSFLALALEAMLFAAAGLLVMMRQLRYGVVASGARESGRRPAAKPRPAAAGAGPEKRALLTPVQARELRLLSRDRNFLVQSLVLPVLVIGAQFWFSTGGDLYASALATPKGLATIAFSMAAYALMFSAFQTLNTEGNALWILYSVPHPIERVLRQKAILWGIVCLLYPLAVFGFALASSRGTYEEMLGLAPIVLAGVPIFAVIATALGVFACDPLAQLVQRRLRPSYMYLYMLLASLYAYTIFASTVWQRASLMVLTALLALALWQKARDHLPYLLDPSASPPARVSLSDGLIAAMMFFVVQGLVGMIFVLSGQKELTGQAVLIAFSTAGASTFLLMRFAFWRLKSEGVPRAFGAGNGRALALGAGGGALAALGAFAYLLLARHTSLLEGARESVLVSVQDQLWIAVLAVAAAPIFEEFIFRGLIFGGLRRTLGLTVSVLASAAIFALVHPPFSVIPVFGLGIAAALVYERTRLLIGPIAVHAVYNAAVVGLQFLPGW